MDASIPVIALDEGSQQCADDLVQAAREWGFLYVSAGSSIPQEKIDRMFELSRKFFASPNERGEGGQVMTAADHLKGRLAATYGWKS